MRRSDRRPVRPGAALVEAAIILPVFLLIILGTIDLGMAVFRYNTLSQAARQGVRQAIVHGEHAPAGWNGGSWGPTTIDEPSTASGIPVVKAVQPMLVGCPPADTRIKVEWLDDINNMSGQKSNEVGKRVRVTVTSEYVPMVAWIFGLESKISLRASSTMPIAH